jgi:uncharacterized protein YjiS (DUF1127 family)
MSNSSIDFRAPQTVFQPGIQGLANFFRQQFARIGRQRQFRRDFNALMELDDNMLVDIGLSRGEVWHAARYGRLPARGDAQSRR